MGQTARQLIRYAMERELQGIDFFRNQAEKMQLSGAKEMLLYLASLEQDHYDYLNEQLAYFEKFQVFKEMDFELDREKNLFEDRFQLENLDQQAIESMVPDLSVLRTAYLLEKDFAEFYQQSAEQTEDPRARKLFETLSLWEQEHERMFREKHQQLMNRYLHQPWGG